MGKAKYLSLRNQQVALQMESEVKKNVMFSAEFCPDLFHQQSSTCQTVSAKCQYAFKNPLMRNYILGTRIRIEPVNRKQH